MPAHLEYLSSLVNGQPLQLLFRASRDGWDGEEFHKWCDNKGGTITLIKTLEGRICGGYASVNWKTKGLFKGMATALIASTPGHKSAANFKEDLMSYLFSVDHQRRLPIKDAKWAVRCERRWGPCFGTGCLHLYLDGTATGRSLVSEETFGDTRDSEGNSILTGSKELFTACEVEVFRVVIS